jgi:sulfur-oxidizing protein SoxZ
MSKPTRIRAQRAGATTQVRVLMSHDMESGFRKDAAGAEVAPWYIQDVKVMLNGQVVVAAQWGRTVSKDPFLEFSVNGARVDDKVEVSWTDNRGDTRSDEVRVS